MKELEAQKLFDFALAHRTEHDCSAYPYEQYQKLQDIVSRVKPKTILEIGTGIGFTSVIMASVVPDAQIDTIEKDRTHFKLANDFIHVQGFGKQVNVIHDIAEIHLPLLVENNKHYDLIFFDGYQIHYEFLPHYEKLLRLGGILILANTQLNSKTSDKFFDELEHDGNWQIANQFDDTIVAHRV